jgi:hypothetical protein
MFYRLILAHLVGDFVLQNRWLVLRKRTFLGLTLHVGLVGVATVAVTWDRLGQWWPWLWVILLVHGVTDWAKVRLEPRLRLPPILPFLADQAVHVLSIAAVVTLAETDGSGLPWSDVEPLWWIASVYLVATFALSIALPLWLDPPSLMRRTLAPRLVLMVASALVLTLAWRGLPMLIPVVGFGLYQGVAGRLARKPANATLATEFMSALVVAASLGWWLL